MSTTLPRVLQPKDKDYALRMPDGPLFSVTAALVRLGVPAHGKPPHDWHDTSDRWLVVVKVQPAATQPAVGMMEFDYWTGVGNRAHPGWPPVERGLKPGTVAQHEQEERKVPVHPDLRSILTCICSDWDTAVQLPPGDAEAMDYLQDEFGNEQKASDLLRLVQALRTMQRKVETMLRGANVKPADFAAWCAELDA